jgi:hypothetical protein
VTDAQLTFASTILGAVIAAVFSWLLARRTSKETLARDAEQRVEAKLGLALQAMVKLKAIIDNTGTTQRMLATALSSAPIQGARPWQCVEPLIGHPGDYLIEFSASELALFMEAGRADIAEHMQMLARKNAVSGAVIKVYNERRVELTTKMPPPAHVEGTHGTTELTQEQYLAVARDMAALDSLINQLIPALAEDLSVGLRVAAEFGPALRRHFKDQRFPQLRVPDAPSPGAPAPE